VWEPEIDLGNPPGADRAYQVTLNNVKINGQSHTFSYTVIIFDPDP
jgi:hypothetical protein